MAFAFFEAQWLPRSILCLHDYSVGKFGRDLVAGITVGLVALPLFRIHGPFLFGATDKISVVTERLHQLPPVVILRLRNMTALDATGLFALEEAAQQLHASGRTLILCGAREQPSRLLHQAEFEQLIGPENICENVQEALRRAEQCYDRLETKFAISKN
jgi:MFS superfamily sulfate permease-like transporter